MFDGASVYKIVQYFCNKCFDDFEQQIQKLQEENEHLKNMLKAHTKDKQ